MTVSVPSPQSMTSRTPSFVLWAVPPVGNRLRVSEDHVPAQMALDPVVVLVPVKHILARVAFEPVVAFVAINFVVPARGVHQVGFGAAHQSVVLVGARPIAGALLLTANAAPAASASTSAAVMESNTSCLTVSIGSDLLAGEN